MSNDEKQKPAITLESPLLIAGIDDRGVAEYLLHDIANSLFFFESESRESRTKRINAAMNTVKALAPQDPMEAKLIVQMVCAHNVAMESTRRSNIPNQTFEGRNISLKYAAKFMGIFQEQLRTLNKYRGKGDQKVTIEHVNVAAGGQAIVGAVSSTSQQPAKRHKAPKALAHTPAETLDLPMPKLREKQPVATKKK